MQNATSICIQSHRAIVLFGVLSISDARRLCSLDGAHRPTAINQFEQKRRKLWCRSWMSINFTAAANTLETDKSFDCEWMRRQWMASIQRSIVWFPIWIIRGNSLRWEAIENESITIVFLSLEGSYPPSFGGRSFALFSWTECHRWALPLVRCAAQNSARANHKYFLQRKGSNTLRMISVLLPPTSTLRFLWPLTWFRVTWHRTPSIMQAIAYRLSVAIFRSFIFWFVFRGRQFWDLELLDYNSVWFSFIQIWPTFWFIYQYLD